MFPKIVGFPQKWMVKIMENPIKMDDLGGKPTIFGNTHMLGICLEPAGPPDSDIKKPGKFHPYDPCMVYLPTFG